MEDKQINISITMLIPQTDCLDIDGISEDLQKILNLYGEIIHIEYTEGE